MAGRDHRAVSNEVNQFLDRRKGDYVKLLRMTQEELVRFKDRFQFRDAIYRIYSRADKQLGGEAFKTPEKITKKLMDWRAKRSSTKVHDIHDIIGITVVVYFETQRDLVAAGLLKRGALGKVRVFDREPKESDGYYAVHMKFASDEPGLDRLKGELQVKTLLHDGWAAKTHDIVYKPPIQLSDDVRKHTNILGETLQLVEKQSEIIRGLIEREIERENRRRRAAQATLMVRMTVRDSRDFDSRAATLARAIHKDLDHLRTSTESDRRFKHHFRNWKKFF
jgi:ppGpp synthetase/RelA/SpoT-type nucleotidyltranferase